MYNCRYFLHLCLSICVWSYDISRCAGQIEPNGGIGLETKFVLPAFNISTMCHLHLDDILYFFQFFLLHRKCQLCLKFESERNFTVIVCFMTSAFSPVAIRSE